MGVQEIGASVGQGGVNRTFDVVVVQQLLFARGHVAVGEADGDCDAATIGAIRDYQAAFLRRPDGLIDAGGRTWRMLSASFAPSTEAAPALDDGSLLRLVPRPPRASLNPGLAAVDNTFMTQLFGDPLAGGTYTSQCQMPTLARLRRNIVTDSVGPFRATGLVPAILGLKAVMADVQAEQPAVYEALGSAGMLCCRLVRGSQTSISNHSWGTAIDLTLDGVLDVYGDDTVQLGLTLIAPIFNRHGWYWGAAFGKEDGMHFEGSRALVSAWASQLR
jgi:hypothetical protein